jgi:hypothetical protein
MIIIQGIYIYILIFDECHDLSFLATIRPFLYRRYLHHMYVLFTIALPGRLHYPYTYLYILVRLLVIYVSTQSSNLSVTTGSKGGTWHNTTDRSRQRFVIVQQHGPQGQGRLH